MNRIPVPAHMKPLLEAQDKRRNNTTIDTVARSRAVQAKIHEGKNELSGKYGAQTGARFAYLASSLINEVATSKLELSEAFNRVTQFREQVIQESKIMPPAFTDRYKN